MPGCLPDMKEREQLERDLEHYRTLLVYIMDEQATAALRQLIWEIRERLDRIEDTDCDPDLPHRSTSPAFVGEPDHRADPRMRR
jgi:hypothetical protein